MRVRVIKTRPPFPHGKHIRRMGVTLMMWAPFYLGAYLWHRFGPTKSVSHASTEGFHKMEAYAKADVNLTAKLYSQQSNISSGIWIDEYNRAWRGDPFTGQWMYAGQVICSPGWCS